jgi:hypothetical protein
MPAEDRESPGQPAAELEPDQEPARLGYAAYFGAAAGLVSGLVLAMLGAAGLHAARPQTDWAEVFWSVASPLLALLGVVLGGVGCHRWMRGQIALPAVLFLTALVVGVWLASGPFGFDWLRP